MRTILVAVLVSVVAFVALAKAEMTMAPKTTVNSDQAVATVRDVATAHDGVVTGVVVNTSNSTLRDVRLMITHEWLWNDEFHPGTDDPGRAVSYTVPGEIPAGGQVRFTTPAEPLPERPGGYFRTRVNVLSLTQVG
jgi:hypothetical protein